MNGAWALKLKEVRWWANAYAFHRRATGSEILGPLFNWNFALSPLGRMLEGRQGGSLMFLQPFVEPHLVPVVEIMNSTLSPSVLQPALLALYAINHPETKILDHPAESVAGGAPSGQIRTSYHTLEATAVFKQLAEAFWPSVIGQT